MAKKEKTAKTNAMRILEKIRYRLLSTLMTVKSL